PCLDGIAAHRVSALRSTTMNQRPEILFPQRPADLMFSKRCGVFPSPPRFHSTSARPASRTYFLPTLSNTIAPPSREDHGVRPQEPQSPHQCVPIARRLPRCVSAPPVPRPCDTLPCVAAGWPSTGRI